MPVLHCCLLSFMDNYPTCWEPLLNVTNVTRQPLQRGSLAFSCNTISNSKSSCPTPPEVPGDGRDAQGRQPSNFREVRGLPQCLRWEASRRKCSGLTGFRQGPGHEYSAAPCAGSPALSCGIPGNGGGTRPESHNTPQVGSLQADIPREPGDLLWPAWWVLGLGSGGPMSFSHALFPLVVAIRAWLLRSLRTRLCDGKKRWETGETP